MSVSIPVQYQITNLAVWAYTNSDPESLLKSIAERSVAHYLASADLDSLMAQGRTAAAAELSSAIQEQADALDLGARILFVGLEDIHPPTKVAKKFEEVVGASETRESKILQAQAYSVSTNSWAEGESFKRLKVADADEHSAITNSAARALLFRNQELAYSAAPGRKGVYEQHASLDALIENSGDSRKYIIATTNVPNIVILNLEDKIRKDLIDQLPAPSSSK